MDCKRGTAGGLIYIGSETENLVGVENYDLSADVDKMPDLPFDFLGIKLGRAVVLV